MQIEFASKGFQNLEYIDSQNHVLELILHYLLDYHCPTASEKSEINYDFDDDVLIGYEKLHNDYIGQEIAPVETEKLKCGDGLQVI